MSPTDNIVSFKGGTKPPSPETEKESDLREESIDYLAAFLLENRARIKHFVCGVTFEAEGSEQAFHVLTSPIDIAEFALTLHFLEDGFRRRLPGATPV